jgi:hypothetical protein
MKHRLTERGRLAGSSRAVNNKERIHGRQAHEWTPVMTICSNAANTIEHSRRLTTESL